MLTPDQRQEFTERGYVRMPGAFDRDAIEALLHRAWTLLEDTRGIRRDDPSTWDVVGPWLGLKELRAGEPALALRSFTLEAAIDELLGAGCWHKPREWGGFKVSVPDCRPEAWCPPADGWHVDFHYTNEPGELFALQVFTFLSEVGPRGGGTLVVRGSHRLVERFVAAMTPDERRAGFRVSKERFQRSHPWFTTLTSGEGTPRERTEFAERTQEIGGVPVRVDELCGSPGDVVLTHPWVLHVTAPNAGPRPRFMLGKHVKRKAVSV